LEGEALTRQEKMLKTWEQSKGLWAEKYGHEFKAIYRPPIMARYIRDKRVAHPLDDTFVFEKRSINALDPEHRPVLIYWVECEGHVIEGWRRGDGRHRRLSPLETTQILRELNTPPFNQ
jgi:hypothetical protein